MTFIPAAEQRDIEHTQGSMNTGAGQHPRTESEEMNECVTLFIHVRVPLRASPLGQLLCAVPSTPLHISY